jgi:hypothetical protein
MMGMDLAKPGADRSVIAVIDPPRSPLFAAAIQVLQQEPDHLARLVTLRDAFPQASLQDIQRVLRETACLFHCAAIAPVAK